MSSSHDAEAFLEHLKAAAEELRRQRADDPKAYDWELIDRKGELLGIISIATHGERCWAETDHSLAIRFEATPAFESYRPLLGALTRAQQADEDRLTRMIWPGPTADSSHSEPSAARFWPNVAAFRAWACKALGGPPPIPEADAFRKKICEVMRTRDSPGVWRFIYLRIDGDCGFIRAPHMRRCQWNGSEWI